MTTIFELQHWKRRLQAEKKHEKIKNTFRILDEKWKTSRGCPFWRFRKQQENYINNLSCRVLLLPGSELSLIAESFGLLNDLLLPFLSILDISCPIFYLHLANVLFDVILPSVLGSSLWSFGQGFPTKYLLNCPDIWHSLHVTKPA